MKIYVITGLLILIGAALSQELQCKSTMDTCIRMSLDTQGISKSDKNKMMKDGLVVLGPDVMNEFNVEKYCILLETVKECIPTTDKCANDALLQGIIAQLSAIKNAITELNCGPYVVNCENQLNKCKEEGMTASKVQQNEIDSLLKPDANHEELIGIIGKENGCEFVEVFNGCHDKIKDQCDADDSNFKPILELTKMAHDQLKCGCTSAVASLILIFASIFIVFHQKSAM